MSSQKTILLIDDEIDLLEMIQFQLESKGYKVVTAQDGEEGLEYLKTLKPHLVILDMNMPKVGGVEFYKRICDTHGRPKYPVLVLTARANMEQLFKDLEVAAFIPKPFEIDHLIREVETIIHQAEGETAPEAGGKAFKRKICIVENDPEVFSRLTNAFVDAGYIVNSAKGGAMALERIMADIPDAVLIKWGLIDIPGDVVIGRLQNMLKAAGVVFVLYKTAGGSRAAIMGNAGDAAKSVVLVDSDDAAEILDIVNRECQKFNK